MGRGGARTKQTARTSTGGAPPRTALAVKCARVSRAGGIKRSWVGNKPPPTKFIKLADGTQVLAYRFPNKNAMGMPPFNHFKSERPVQFKIPCAEKEMVDLLAKSLKKLQRSFLLVGHDEKKEREQLQELFGDAASAENMPTIVAYEPLEDKILDLRTVLLERNAESFQQRGSGLGMAPIVVSEAVTPDQYTPPGFKYKWDACKMPLGLTDEEANGPPSEQMSFVPPYPMVSWLNALDDALQALRKRAATRLVGGNKLTKASVLYLFFGGACVGLARAGGQSQMKDFGKTILDAVYEIPEWKGVPTVWGSLPAGGCGAKEEGDVDADAGFVAVTPEHVRPEGFFILVHAAWLGQAGIVYVHPRRNPRADVHVAGMGTLTEQQQNYVDPACFGPPMAGEPVRLSEMYRAQYLRDILSSAGCPKDKHYGNWVLEDPWSDNLEELYEQGGDVYLPPPIDLHKFYDGGVPDPSRVLGWTKGEKLGGDEPPPTQVNVLSALGKIGTADVLDDRVVVRKSQTNSPYFARVAIGAGIASEKALLGTLQDVKRRLNLYDEVPRLCMLSLRSLSHSSELFSFRGTTAAPPHAQLW